MSVCLALDATGRSLAVPPRYVGGAEYTITKFRIALESILGDWREDKNKGLPWPTWWQSPGLPAVLIEGEIRKQALAIDGLVEVREVTATLVGDQLGIEIRIAISEDDSITEARVAAGAIEILPGVWYMLIEPLTGVILP